MPPKRTDKASRTKAEESRNKIVATNRQARRHYEIIDTVEAGIVLRGSEGKALREAKVQLADSYGRVNGGEGGLHGLHIPGSSQAGRFDSHPPERERKLLLHRTEIDRLRSRLDTERLTLVPL